MFDVGKRLGISREYLEDVIARSKSVDVSEKESAIVNRWTKPDVIIDMLTNWNRGTYSERLIKMLKGKIEDYKLFVVIYIDYENSLPQKIQAYMRYSPCGRAKMEALMIRAFVQSDPVTLA